MPTATGQQPDVPGEDGWRTSARALRILVSLIFHPCVTPRRVLAPAGQTMLMYLKISPPRSSLVRSGRRELGKAREVGCRESMGPTVAGGQPDRRRYVAACGGEPLRGPDEMIVGMS